jgi:hypothetical protein
MSCFDLKDEGSIKYLLIGFDNNRRFKYNVLFQSKQTSATTCWGDLQGFSESVVNVLSLRFYHNTVYTHSGTDEKIFILLHSI